MADGPAPIAEALLAWYDRHGRHDLPWKSGRDPYRIWLSEIMLQQTRVTTVLPYFERFIEAFPDVHALADAEPDRVLNLWTGLGYYARARNLHAAARRIVDEHDGRMPEEPETLRALPGIGPSTAGAIAAMAHDVRAPILDGNVRRVLARLTGIERWPGERVVEKQLWGLADALTPQERVADYTQAIMDLGATVCTPRRPACELCPLAADCRARAEGLTDRIPAASPKRARPERHTRMLMIQDPDARVLLERRPPQGIWGGLWCFPQLDEEADLESGLRSLLQLPEDTELTSAPWATFHHTFTHFRLHICPVRVQLPHPAHNVRDDDRDWFDPSSAPNVGLAAPVKRLLGLLADDLAIPHR